VDKVTQSANATYAKKC